MDDEKTLDDSVNNDELNEEETSENQTGDETENSEENANSEADKSEEKAGEEEEIPDYRPKKPEEKQTEKPKDVPFNTFLSEKKRRQAAERKLKELETGKAKKDNEASGEEDDDYDDLDDRIERKAKELISPLLSKQQETENARNFEKDFERNIVSKYPELKEKKDQFQEIAFNPSLVDKYPTLESIRQAFWPDVKPVDTKKTRTEAGSEGTSRGTETVDFAKVDSNPELYHKVMADPVLKGKYFAYLDSQGL